MEKNIKAYISRTEKENNELKLLMAEKNKEIAKLHKYKERQYSAFEYYILFILEKFQLTILNMYAYRFLFMFKFFYIQQE